MNLIQLSTSVLPDAPTQSETQIMNCIVEMTKLWREYQYWEKKL